MMKVQKRPVIVDCVQYKNDNLKEVLDFCKKAYVNQHNELLYIQTLEGKTLVSDGDYIIKGVQGEYYPVKPDIFKQTYFVRDLSFFEDLKKQIENDEAFLKKVCDRIYKETDDWEQTLPEPEWIDRMTEAAERYLMRYKSLMSSLEVR